MALKGSREIGKLELKVPFLRKGYLFPISKLKVSPDGEISKCGTLFSSGWVHVGRSGRPITRWPRLLRNNI